ncbi:MAG: DUF2283 domain-containing protein [Dehalococcoidia bacterium]|nr:DUF2283 domain-containing protein [Dehalococcoidia bacterium]
MVVGPVSYDREADVLYVALRDDDTVDHSASLDDIRIIDYSADGAVVGIEFVNASSGVDLSDVPFQHKVEQLIGDSGLAIRVLA